MYPSFPPASLSPPEGTKKEEEEEFECSPKDSTVVAFFPHAAQGKIATFAHFRSQRGGGEGVGVYERNRSPTSLSRSRGGLWSNAGAGQKQASELLMRAERDPPNYHIFYTFSTLYFSAGFGFPESRLHKYIWYVEVGVRNIPWYSRIVYNKQPWRHYIKKVGGSLPTFFPPSALSLYTLPPAHVVRALLWINNS